MRPLILMHRRHHRRHRPEDHGVCSGVERGRSQSLVGRPRNSCHQSMRPRKSRERRSWVCTHRPNTWRGTLSCDRPLHGNMRRSLGHRLAAETRSGGSGYLLPSTAHQNGNRNRRRSTIGTQNGKPNRRRSTIGTQDGNRLQSQWMHSHHGLRRIGQLLPETKHTMSGQTLIPARRTSCQTAVEKLGNAVGPMNGPTTVTTENRGIK